MTHERIVTRAASPRPSTVDEEARTVELVVGTEADVGDGVVLSMARLPDFGPGPVPVLLDHQNSTSAMAGRLEALRIERRQLIGLARFTDAPAADEGWQLARSGVAVSVGASVDANYLEPQARGPDVATRWRLREVSLTPVAADAAAVTRSLNPPKHRTMEDLKQTNHQAAEDLEDAPRNQFELSVRRAAGPLGLAEETVDELLAQRFASRTDAMVEVIRRHRLAVEAANPVHAGHPARTALFDTGSREDGPGSPLQKAIERCVRGEGAGERPLVEVLRAHGFEGRTAGDVLRAALSGNRPENWLKRTFSTSDAKELLLGAGDRRLQERYAEAESGILQIARTRPLADFREAGVLDAGLVGKALKILEGGEISYASVNATAAGYKPTRYGIGLKFTFESMANDDLGGLAQAIDEIRATIPEQEAAELVALLTSGAGGNGALAPDGAQLFASAHANSVTGAMDVGGLADAVQALRTQTTVGGRALNLAPGYVLCGPEQETAALQLLSETWAAAVPEDANPWKRLQLLIEPTLQGGTFYVVAAGPRQPLELGQVAGMPRMQETTDFDTSSLKVKIEGAFGVAVADHRVICRVKPA